MHAKIDTRLECLLTSTSFRSHKRAQAKTKQEKERKMQEASRVRADTLTKFARCGRENSLTHASLTLMLSTAQLVPSRSDISHSLQPWQAMRSTASESLIQLLLHLSSPFGAGSRAEVVDAEKYKAKCPTVLGAQNFFPFSNRNKSSQSSTITVILRQSTVEVIPRNRIVFPFSIFWIVFKH